ncbi:uncharacterized protein LOC143537448 [Bidens hawaiensis]|uniref:uncharacterized protein LOC143537448 n=1 Tax=Bidens hawaiensis TaxID=980011 RepID=UPI00404A2E6A
MATTDHHLHLTTTCSKLNIPSVFFFFFLYDIISFIFSFILSHPLYFSYVIFFSPYILKFISFNSPLLLLLSVIASTLPLSKLGFIQTARSKMNDDVEDNNNDNNEFRQFEDLEMYKTVFHAPPPVFTDGNGDDGHVAVTSNNLESLFEELDRFEGSTKKKTLEVVTSSVSGEDIESDEDSWRLDSSSSGFGSCGSTAASSPIGGVAGEVQKLELLTSSFSGEYEKTVKSNLTAAIKMKDYKTTSHVHEVLKKFEPVTSSDSGRNQKTVKSYSTVTSAFAGEDQKDVKSVSAAAIEQKLLPVTSSISGEELKTGKSSSTVAIVKSSLVTSSFSGEGIKTVISDSTMTSSISGEDIKKAKSSSTVTSSNSGEDQKPVKSHSTVGEVYRNSSPAVTSSIPGEGKSSVQNSHSMQLISWRLDSSTSFSSYGSMRKEKEWKRTLACKLFEERNNSEGGEEGMDSLWEAYEDDNKRESRNRKEAMVNNNNNVSSKKKNKKSEFKYFDDGEDEDEDDDEFMSNGQLCCLKALKLSTGKMNLGMGKPNLVKIGKAIKGFGWLHHVGSKHG